MILETKRLLLRPWTIEDAESLYEFAKDSKVGPIAGWPVHKSMENSRDIIQSVLSAKETYAVVLKSTGKAIGSIGLMIGFSSHLDISNDQAEVGYWIGVPYWGQGLIPEAFATIMKYAFLELNMNTIWCGYFEGNEKSKRVIEKCGLKYHHTDENIEWEIMNDIRTNHYSCIKKEEWNLLKK